MPLSARVPPSGTSVAAPEPTRVDAAELVALAALARGMRLWQGVRGDAAAPGATASRRRGRGMDFRESRVYQAGDEIRHMDWRVTARTGRPHTKLFEEEREQELLLLIDHNPSMHFGTRARFKSVQAARAAALLTWAATAAGDRVGAVGFGGGLSAALKPAGGRRGALQVLRALREWDRAARAGESSSLQAALGRLHPLLRPGLRVVLLSDGFSADEADAPLLARLAARHDCALVLLQDALELAPPPPGIYALDVDGQRSVLDFSERQLRLAWPTGFAAAREALERRCRSLGMRVVRLDTDGDLRRSLRPLLLRWSKTS